MARTRFLRASFLGSRSRCMPLRGARLMSPLELRIIDQCHGDYSTLRYHVLVDGAKSPCSNEPPFLSFPPSFSNSLTRRKKLVGQSMQSHLSASIRTIWLLSSMTWLAVRLSKLPFKKLSRSLLRRSRMQTLILQNNVPCIFLVNPAFTHAWSISSLNSRALGVSLITPPKLLQSSLSDGGGVPPYRNSIVRFFYIRSNLA